MADRSEPLALAAEFPAATREDWRELVAGVLRRSGGAYADPDLDPEAALSTRLYDGIDVKPLYTAHDGLSVAHDGLPGHPPFVRAASRDGATATGWDVRQLHLDSDPRRTNAAALTDLANGATSLWLRVGDGGTAVADLAAALDGVYLDLAPIALEAGAQTEAAAAALLTLADERGVRREELSGTLGADPIGTFARTGTAGDLGVLARLAQLSASSPRLRVATVDGTVYADAGGNDSDEIGICASIGVAYLRALTDAGLPIDDALAALEFRHAVNADQFAGIAKLRAARRVWDRIAELSGAAASRTGQVQHAVTSAAMLTRRDPWVNMLRTTIACFAAAVGGAQAITVLPFDSALGLPDDLGRRIARNTQSILHDESSLARVVDAAGGSWYVETLTDQLAERAWQTFVLLERAGGALCALADGTVEPLLATTREQRRGDIARRLAPITGVSEFAFLDEQPLSRPAAPEPPAGGPLPRLRYAQEFEQLRDRSDATSRRPAVFLAALGPPAAYAGRVAFAGNLFQAGGIEPITGTGTADDVITEFIAADTPVVCLCSSDQVYADTAAWVAKALREAGAEYVWLAGRPPTDGDSSGIDGYLFAGCDALDVLRTTLDALAVPA
jgi:methylmalonyl-CoA mutase